MIGDYNDRQILFGSVNKVTLAGEGGQRTTIHNFYSFTLYRTAIRKSNVMT